jgi:hypothetical protein
MLLIAMHQAEDAQSTTPMSQARSAGLLPSCDPNDCLWLKIRAHCTLASSLAGSTFVTLQWIA